MRHRNDIVARINKAKQSLANYKEAADVFKEEIAEREKEVEVLEWVLEESYPILGPVVNEQKVAEKWNEGYQIGLTWPDIWDKHPEPGGPFIDGRSRNDGIREQSVAENKAWREGWRKGHADKLSSKRSNPPR